MRDQDIYKEIGKLLFDEVGNIDKTINFSAHISSDRSSVGKTVWKGDYIDATSSVRLSNNTSHPLTLLVIDLNLYYKNESMGVWNLMLYKLAPHGKSFSIDFEFNEDIANGKMTM